MMQQEFEQRIGYGISVDDYEKVEKVYMEVNPLSKDDIAALYKFDSILVLKKLSKHAEYVETLRTHLGGMCDVCSDNVNLIEENKILRNRVADLQKQLKDEWDECYDTCVSGKVKKICELRRVNDMLEKQIMELVIELRKYK